jgi:hypothetical protein
MAAKLFERLFAASFRMINRRRVWHRLPFVLSVANLAALSIDLRRRNLFDTETSPPDLAPREISTFAIAGLPMGASTIYRKVGWEWHRCASGATRR